MGTPDFAKESLEAIYNAGHNIIAVITNPDRPKGRGMKMISSPVKEFAVEKNKGNKRHIGTIKSRFILCCGLWKNLTKRYIRHSKKRFNKCTWFSSS